MDILSSRLEAINPTLTTPATLLITAREGTECIVGRPNFFDGNDTSISRQHARFQVSRQNLSEQLLLTNLSQVNGILANFVPVPHSHTITLTTGDEIVTPLLNFINFSSAFQWHME
jgi:hypothetical protein